MIKVKRMVEGKPAELEIEESELQDGDEKITAPAPVTKPEKTLPQSEVNKLMAEERRKHREALEALTTEYTEYKSGVEAREAAANEAAKKQAESLRKNLPEPVLKLLDRLTPTEQLEWLTDPANVIERQVIPKLPNERDDAGKAPRAQTII